MMDTTFTVLYYISLPIIKPIHWLLIALSPFWYLIQFILLPVVYLFSFILDVLLFPFRLQLLDRVETIYIYLGIAGLVGIITGGILHFSFQFLSSALNIETGEHAHANGRTIAAYREERKKKARSLAQPSFRAISRNEDPRSSRKSGLSSQTIIEEGDSDF